MIELSDREFESGLAGLEDMANHMLKNRGEKCVGMLWTHQFVQRRQELKKYVNRVYDFHRALCEGPENIGG